MNKNLFNLLILLLSFGLTACQDVVDAPAPQRGVTSFSLASFTQEIRIFPGGVQVQKGTDIRLDIVRFGQNMSPLTVSNDVTFTSSDSTIANVVNGRLVAYHIGTVEITATYSDSDGTFTSSSEFQVVASPTEQTEVEPWFALISPTNYVLDIEKPAENKSVLTLDVYYSDGSIDRSVSNATFISDNPSVISVNGNMAIAVATGNAAVKGSVVIGTDTLFHEVGLMAIDSYTEPTRFVTGLTMTPQGEFLEIGSYVNMTVIRYYSDGTDEDVTNMVDFASSDAGKATVMGYRVTGVSEGNVRITATVDGRSVQASLRIVKPQPTTGDFRITCSVTGNISIEGLGEYACGDRVNGVEPGFYSGIITAHDGNHHDFIFDFYVEVGDLTQIHYTLIKIEIVETGHPVTFWTGDVSIHAGKPVFNFGSFPETRRATRIEVVIEYSANQPIELIEMISTGLTTGNQILSGKIGDTNGTLEGLTTWLMGENYGDEEYSIRGESRYGPQHWSSHVKKMTAYYD